MPKNVMKLSKPSPHRARNDFDLSHRHVMSMNFGELIPTTCIETVPGDHIEMHAADLIRAIPLVTSPFLRAKQHLDVWFVPYHDLWHQFDNFITQKSQPVSSALKAHAFCPHVSIYDLYAGLDVFGVGDDDIVGRAVNLGGKRLLNYLGYGYYLTGSAATMPKVNPFRLAAYNYIWYNEYRNQFYDTGSHLLDSSLNASYLFSFDDLNCSSQANAQLPFSSTAEKTRLEAMCQMRYRTWKKDLFTGLLPATQFGLVSTLGMTYVRTYESQGTSTVVYDGTNNSLYQNPNNGRISSHVNGVSDKAVIADGIDVLALRRSEAIQVWREAALRAGNRVKDNMMAHYGVESGLHDHKPVFLGSVSSPLNIGDVMTTANSTTGVNDTVGDIAGKGLSSLDEKVFKFDAKDFGVIMCIASLLPEAEYNAQGISRPNQLIESEDFFIPEYENLGLEAVSSLTFMEAAVSAAKVLGYAPRYWAYKTKVDKCYDIFKTGGINAPWCSPKFDVTAALATPQTTMPLELLYVNPKIYDVNFSVGVDTQPQFLCDFYFDVDAVRPMSVVGLPFS